MPSLSSKCDSTKSFTSPVLNLWYTLFSKQTSTAFSINSSPDGTRRWPANASVIHDICNASNKIIKYRIEITYQ